MRTFFFSLSFCFFTAAAIVAGAALTIPFQAPFATGTSRTTPAGPGPETEKMLDWIAAEQAASAALINDLRNQISSLGKELALREATAALEQKEERTALEEENRRLLSELQEAFEDLKEERTEAAEKEGAARLAGEEASRAALDQLQQTVDELRVELKAERERFETARLDAGEAEKPGLPEENATASGTPVGEEGATAVPTPAIRSEETGTVIAILGGGLFGSGENIVTPGLERAVQKALPAIVTSPGSSIIVEGHSDSQPLSRNLARRFGDNRTLSLLRAQTVADILIRAGVESSRITSVGFGGTRPIAPNQTADGRAENRRVEIRLVPPGAMPEPPGELQDGG